MIREDKQLLTFLELKKLDSLLEKYRGKELTKEDFNKEFRIRQPVYNYLKTKNMIKETRKPDKNGILKDFIICS